MKSFWESIAENGYTKLNIVNHKFGNCDIMVTNYNDRNELNLSIHGSPIISITDYFGKDETNFTPYHRGSEGELLKMKLLLFKMVKLYLNH